MEHTVGRRIDESLVNLTLQSVNPWEQESRAVAAIRNCLVLAQQKGLYHLTSESDSKCTQALSRLPSTQLIHFQKEITETNKSCCQVKEKIASVTQQRELTEVLSNVLIEQRISMVNQLCTDLDVVLKNTEKLVHRLQKPLVGDHLQVNAPYQKYARKVCSQLVSTMNDLAASLDNMSWLANSNLSSSQLDPLQAETKTLRASLQTSVHVLTQLSSGIHQLTRTDSVTGEDQSMPSLMSFRNSPDNSSMYTVSTSKQCSEPLTSQGLLER